MQKAQFSTPHAEVFDLLHQTKDYRSEVDFVLKLASSALGHPPKGVLDLACGSGAHLAHFATQDIPAHGNDLSAAMIHRAKQRLSTYPRSQFSLSRAPMQLIQRASIPSSFKIELATVFYTALGYLTKTDELHQFFETVRTLLEPRGCFFADVWNETMMAHAFSPHRSKVARNETLEVRRESFVSHEPQLKCLNVRFHFHVKDTNAGVTTEFNEDHLVRYFTPTDLESILNTHDFDVVKIGPFFDAAKELRDCWNFFVLAQLR